MEWSMDLIGVLGVDCGSGHLTRVRRARDA